MKRRCIAIALVSFLGRVVAHETCPTEVKVLLASPAAQPAIAAFGFKKEAASVVYFYDTNSRELLLHGVIIRIRQGSNNDLTVKLRPPNGNAAEEMSRLRAQFACEVDRTQAAEIESYAVERQYETAKIPEIGADVYDRLSDSQKQLLRAARFSIDWTRVKRIATINSTQWKTSRRSAYGKLALELWEWPAGRILEVSAKISPAQYASNRLDLADLVRAKGLPLSLDQNTKTTTVLRSADSSSQ